MGLCDLCERGGTTRGGHQGHFVGLPEANLDVNAPILAFPEGLDVLGQDVRQLLIQSLVHLQSSTQAR